MISAEGKREGAMFISFFFASQGSPHASRLIENDVVPGHGNDLPERGWVWGCIIVGQLAVALSKLEAPQGSQK